VLKIESTVLIVDDEKAIVDILKFNLEQRGFRTVVAYDGAEALRLATSISFDIILLDVMLPSIDGFEVCWRLRAENNNVPIIMLTAREEETDKVMGLEIGADDYITKPFSMRELLARVDANVRRAQNSEIPASVTRDEDLLIRGALVIDLQNYMVSKRGVPIDLTQREYELLCHLAQTPGKVMSRQELLSEVWQFDYFGDLRAVDVAIRRLREKLEDNPAIPQLVLTKRGIGYYFQLTEMLDID
jgi:two-component system response regulator VicR